MDTKSLIQIGQKLNGGLSNEIYRLKGDKILRVKRNSDPYFYNAETELTAQRYASEISLAPCIFDCNSNGDLLMEEVHGHPFHYREEKGYFSLLSLITKIHSLPLLPVSFSPIERVLTYRVSDFSKKEEQCLLWAKSFFQNTDSFVFSHNDLVPGNLLEKDDGTYMLIDFEFAGNNHPYFDFVSFFTEGDSALRKEIKPAFSFLLGERKCNEEWNNIVFLTAFEDLLWREWAKGRYHQTKNDTFLLIAKEKDAFLQKELSRIFKDK